MHERLARVAATTRRMAAASMRTGSDRAAVAYVWPPEDDLARWLNACSRPPDRRRRRRGD